MDEQRSVVFETRLETALERREKGNACFTRGEFADAKEWYGKGLYHCDFDELQYNFELQDQHRQAVDDVRVPLLLNLAACALKLEEYESAIERCSEALKFKPESAKALYRRGLSYQKTGKLDLAKQDLAKAVKHKPNDPALRNSLRAVLESLKEEQRLGNTLWQGKLDQPIESPAPESHGKKNICDRIVHYIFSFFEKEKNM